MLDNMSLEEVQNKLFLDNGYADRQYCIDILNGVLSKPFASKNFVNSEHLLLITAISLKYQDSVKNILEIGTFEGATTSVMSVLFPNASIVTIDLPEDELEVFAFNKYRNDTLTTTKKSLVSGFRENRINLLESLSNVKFIETNSVNLTNWESNQFDLIWVDGNHEYPTSCIDIINSYRLLTSTGIMLLDNVYTTKTLSYCDDSVYETLNLLKNSKLINDFCLFYKKFVQSNETKPQTYFGYFKK